MKFSFFINLIFIILSIINPSISKSYCALNRSNINNINYISSQSLYPMLEKVLPSVVSIYTEGFKSNKYILPDEFKHFFGHNFNYNRERYFEGLGSGVILDSKKGYVVTNYHVIVHANRIRVKLNDGREFYAKVIGCDERTDIAVLQLKSPKNLIEIKIANSDDLKIGDFVLAIGNPFGLGQSVTSGIVSALGRSGLNPNGLENYIQTDASINKGNSGGALINISGELIGMNTAILAPNGGNIGIGFAIPSNIIKNLSDQIIKFGEVRRGQLGIKGTELTIDIIKAFKLNVKQGAFVSEVIFGSAAYKHGIKSGDIIVSFDGKDIKSFSELKYKIATTIPGKNIQIGIVRDGNYQTINIKLDDNNSFLLRKGEKILFNILKNTTLKNFRSKKSIISGVLIEDINKNSYAYKIGLRNKDIIIGLNKDKIKNVIQLKKYVNKKIDFIAINIIRNKSNMFLLLKF